MAKGATCPSCGEETFQKQKNKSRKCSACGAAGWFGSYEWPTGGGGKGKKCHSCGEATLVQAGDSVRVCTSCKAVVIL